jgi:hypothetical protein
MIANVVAAHSTMVNATATIRREDGSAGRADCIESFRRPQGSLRSTEYEDEDNNQENGAGADIHFVFLFSV